MHSTEAFMLYRLSAPCEYSRLGVSGVTQRRKAAPAQGAPGGFRMATSTGKELLVMGFSHRSSFALGLLLAATAAAALAAPRVEGTPIPTAPKPDWSTMHFLIGTWKCTDYSSRRPGPFQTTEVYSMDSTGYWMIRNDTIHTASWIPHEIQNQTKYTWDPYAHRWVRITTGDSGNYAVATAGMPVNGKTTYTYVIQAKSPDVASYAPEVYLTMGGMKPTMTTSFTETTGRVVTVKEMCIKDTATM